MQPRCSSSLKLRASCSMPSSNDLQKLAKLTHRLSLPFAFKGGSSGLAPLAARSLAPPLSPLRFGGKLDDAEIGHRLVERDDRLHAIRVVGDDPVSQHPVNGHRAGRAVASD